MLLARGDGAEALPLLEASLAGNPDDEGCLADVLRAEAQVRGVPAALARFASYAARIREDLGASPGPDLARLHAELLAREAPVRQGLKYDATPLVGRDDDVAGIRGLLESSRVVSIVGAGGLGKTRMAHLVGRLSEQPVVHFVELAGVTSAEGVLPEVAGALGVRESVTSVRTAQLRADLRGRVAEQLSGPPTLLILDNCEHLVDAVADLVAFLVATTDATSVLTTTRAPLGIAAEKVYLLPQLGSQDAVELFHQRARSARSDARLDDDEVTALVDRLDGLPLAIELAAAKVRVMSVAEIARRLEDRFLLLSGRDRSAPDRHQTLEAVIAWSWNLLGDDDQQALRTLAMFPDGFSLDGAEALLGRDPLPSLIELVDQSLLVVREGATLRYRFLETVREYGLKQLEATGETRAVRERLQQWAVLLARELVDRLFSPDQVETMGRIRAEAGNLAGVMRTAIDAEDAVTVVPLVGVLAGFWTIEGDHLGVLQVAREVIDLVAAAPQPGPRARGRDAGRAVPGDRDHHAVQRRTAGRRREAAQGARARGRPQPHGRTDAAAAGGVRRGRPIARGARPALRGRRPDRGARCPPVGHPGTRERRRHRGCDRRRPQGTGAVRRRRRALDAGPVRGPGHRTRHPGGGLGGVRRARAADRSRSCGPSAPTRT